jgi:hypothetical protein
MYSPALQSGPTRIIGPVWTVKFVSKSDLEAPKIKGHYVRVYFASEEELLNIAVPSLP